jgi:hypothetical protein
MPAVRFGNGRVEYPILRSLKFWDDGDLLSDWFDFLSQGGEQLLH